MSKTDAQSKSEEELPPLLDVEQAEEVAADAEAAADDADMSDAETVDGPEAGEPAEIPQAANDSDTNAETAMETVRDLLFGDSVRSLRRELHLTVRNLRGTVKVVHREFKARADELADQISALQLAIDNEATEREELASGLSKQVTQASEQLQSKLTDQNDALDVAVKQVNADIELQDNNHQHALEELEKKVFAALEEYSTEFRDGKMNRNEFAQMLASLAGKVNEAD